MLRDRSLRTTAVGAVALALLGGSAFAAVASAAPRASSVPRVAACTTGGLVEWMDTDGNGAAGTIFYTLEFTNLSGHTCTLRGYPGVSGITLSGAQIGSAADRDGTSPVRTVTLREGKTATALLGIVDTGDFSRSACRPTTAAGLRIYAPNQTVPKSIPFPFSACARSATHYLKIEAITSS